MQTEASAPLPAAERSAAAASAQAAGSGGADARGERGGRRTAEAGPKAGTDKNADASSSAGSAAAAHGRDASPDTPQGPADAARAEARPAPRADRGATSSDDGGKTPVREPAVDDARAERLDAAQAPAAGGHAGPATHAPAAAAAGPAAPAPAPQQPAPVPTEQTGAEAPAGDAVEMTDPEWPADLVDRVLTRLRRDGGEVEIRLSPETLGPLRVRLDVSDGLAQVAFHTDNASAAQLLSQGEARLAAQFARHDLALNGHAVSTGGGGQGGGGGDAGNPRRGRPHAGPDLAPPEPRSGAGLVNLLA